MVFIGNGISSGSLVFLIIFMVVLLVMVVVVLA